VYDEAAARRILTTLGLDPATAALAPVGDGFASDAWRLDTADDAPAVLRVANDRGLVDVTYPMEHALMARLHAAGAPVPRPLDGSWQHADWDGLAWSLTTWAPGRPLQAGDHPRAIPALTTFVRALRAIPIRGGHGPLVVDGDGFRGADATAGDGLVRWAERPMWPLDRSRLADHPAIGEDPSLVVLMEAHADDVRQALVDGPRSILHSDLHGENVLDDDGHLTVIDFGEALVGPVDWDIAAIGFVHDGPTADAVAAALDDAPRRRTTVARIGLAFGAYRWHLSREHAFDDDDHDRAYLETCLDRLTRRGQREAPDRSPGLRGEEERR
jgi:aminoglycoside phosphotransferase (APT) family kinase protein